MIFCEGNIQNILSLTILTQLRFSVWLVNFKGIKIPKFPIEKIPIVKIVNGKNHT